MDRISSGNDFKEVEKMSFLTENRLAELTQSEAMCERLELILIQLVVDLGLPTQEGSEYMNLVRKLPISNNVSDEEVKGLYNLKFLPRDAVISAYPQATQEKRTKAHATNLRRNLEQALKMIICAEKRIRISEIFGGNEQQIIGKGLKKENQKIDILFLIPSQALYRRMLDFITYKLKLGGGKNDPEFTAAFEYKHLLDEYRNAIIYKRVKD